VELALVTQLVELGVISWLSSTLPAAAFLILALKPDTAEADNPAYLTPTETTLIVAPESKSAGVAVKFKSSIWLSVVSAL
jgi:hypothetical protein